MATHDGDRNAAERDESGWRALAAHAAGLQALLRRLPGVAWCTDRELRITDIEGARVHAGTDPSRWIGRPIAELSGPSAQVVVAAHRRALEGESASYRTRIQAYDFDATVEPLRGPGGEIVGCTGLAIDVTPEVAALRARAAEERKRHQELAAIADNMPDIIVRYDRDLRVSFVNEVAVRTAARPRESFLGKRFRELGFAPEVADRAVRDLEHVLRTGEPTEIEYPYDGPAGQRWMQGRAAPERDESGAIVGVVTVTRDVTERKHAELAAHAADALVRAFFEQAEVGIGISDPDGRYVRVNRAFAQLLGYGVDELTSRTLADIVPPDAQEAVRARTRSVYTGERKAYTVEGEYVCKDGRRTWLRVNVSPLREPGGRTHLIAVAQDISKRKGAEDALRASEERFRALVENVSDLIAIVDERGAIRYASPSHEAVFGAGPERLRGLSVLEYVHPDDREKIVRAFARAMEGHGAVRGEPLRIRAADGAWRTIEPILNDLRSMPSVGGIVSNSRDVTDRVRLEERLRQSQKLEALGQLAGGVAHDFNNILASVLMYARALADDLPPAHPRRADAEEIVRAGTRGAAVVKQLLAFSRAQPLDLEVLDLAAAARDTGRMLRALLPASIQLELPAEDAPPVAVRASRTGIAQILLNLAVNARDAMADGGRLAISVATRTTDGGSEAVLEARDTGRGIPADIRDRIFDPFFTTKGVGEGTGLGLATVYGLTRQFGGTVSVDSEEGRGTTFVVTFPRADALPAAAPAPAAERAPSVAATGAKRRVLLVEDEAPIARVARRILERAGYEVVADADGAAALERVHRGERFDVVLTDAAMPRVNGWQLADALRRVQAGTPVVLMSGYAELSEATGQVDAGPRLADAGVGPPRTDGVTAAPPAEPRSAARFAAFLQKPFTPEELLEIVRRCLPPA